MPETECEGHRPAGAVASVLGGAEDATRLIRSERLDLGPLDPRRVDQAADVARDPATLHGDRESPGEHPVGLQHAGRRQARGEELGVHPFHVLGLQSIQPVVADLGNELVRHQLAVPLQGGRAHLRRGDRVPPVLQPGGNGHLSTGHRSHALVATSFELPNLAMHVFAAPTRDMTPVAASVVG